MLGCCTILSQTGTCKEKSHLTLRYKVSTDTFLFPMFSGTVVTQECVEKLIKKDMTDPVTGDKLSEKDIIPLQRVRVYFFIDVK